MTGQYNRLSQPNTHTLEQRQLTVWGNLAGPGEKLITGVAAIVLDAAELR